MTTPTRQFLSQTAYDTDGVTTVWDFSMAGGYISTEHVKVAYRDKVTSITTQIPITAANFLGEYQLSITPAVADGLEIIIYRDTPKSTPLVNFADRAALTEAALDLNAKQAVFVAAEFSDFIASSAQNLSYLPSSTAAGITSVPAGSLAAITVQGALNELDNEKASSVAVTAEVAVSTAAAAAATALLRSDLAATTGAGLGGFDFAALPAAINKIDWAIKNVETGVNVLRYIPPAQWAAIFARTSTYNASADIQAALGGYAVARVVFMPPGGYVLGSGLSMGINKRLLGRSSSEVELQFNSVDAYCITGDAYSQLESVTLTNLTATGSKVGVASYTPTTANGWRNGLIRDVVINDFFVGIGSTQGLTQGLMFQNSYERVRVYGASVGVQMGAGCNANTFINCVFWNCARAVDLNNATTITFIGCGFEGSTTYDFYVDTSYNVKFDTCYFEPARGGIFSASTGSFDNCHSTDFATPTTRFLGHLAGSYVTMKDFTDYNLGGGSNAAQEYYKSLDLTGQVIGTNVRVRTGTEKTIPPALDGVIVSSVAAGDWIVTRYGDGVMHMSCNTDISTNTVIMAGAVTDYSATLTLPDAFVNGAYVATAGIFCNASATFLLIDSPLIAVRPITGTTLDIAAKRATAGAVDGYFYAIHCVGRWK